MLTILTVTHRQTHRHRNGQAHGNMQNLQIFLKNKSMYDITNK